MSLVWNETYRDWVLYVCFPFNWRGFSEWNAGPLRWITMKMLMRWPRSPIESNQMWHAIEVNQINLNSIFECLVDRVHSQSSNPDKLIPFNSIDANRDKFKGQIDFSNGAMRVSDSNWHLTNSFIVWPWELGKIRATTIRFRQIN